MARKPKSSNTPGSFDLESLKARMNAATGGDLPFLASCPPDEEHKLKVYLPSITEIKDAGPTKSWSAFNVEAVIGSAKQDIMEIPFWAMQAFTAAVEEFGEQHDDGWLDLVYIRTFGPDGKNRGVFN